MTPDAFIRACGLFRRLRRDKKGASAVETALFFSLALFPLSAIVIEGYSYFRVNEIASDALSAAVLRAGHDPDAGRSSREMTTVARLAIGERDDSSTSAVTVQVRTVCFCLSTLEARGPDAPPVACASRCGGNDPAEYSTITVTTNYTPILPVPGFAGGDIQKTSRVRID